MGALSISHSPIDQIHQTKLFTVGQFFYRFSRGAVLFISSLLPPALTELALLFVMNCSDVCSLVKDIVLAGFGSEID